VGKAYRVAGRTYVPSERKVVGQVGMASWYGAAFHGRKTANGEIFDRHSLSAAHPTMPLPSYARVTNLSNGRSIVVRVNDRGPFHGGRIIDVSQRVADALDFRRFGTARVRVDQIGTARLAGSDDRQLLATLKTDGTPASYAGGSSPPILLAAAREIAPRPSPSAPTAPRVAQPEIPPAVAAAAPAAAQPPAGAKVAVPLPPDRPFDLGAPDRRVASAAAAPRVPLLRLAAHRPPGPPPRSLAGASFYAPPEMKPAPLQRGSEAFRPLYNLGFRP
jgi:rare lipoprotein A